MKDPYILEDGTLKNLLGITDYGELNKAEKDICFIKLVNLDEAVPHVFDSNMFKNYINIYLKIFFHGLVNLEQFQFIKKKLLFLV